MPESLTDHQRKIQFIGHRGFRADNPENTLHAFKKVINNPLEDIAGIELDVQLSADGKLVIFHDRTMKRLFKKKIKILNTDYSVIKKVVTSSGVIDAHNVPLLDDVLNIAMHKKKILVEIKGFSTDYKLMARCIRVVMEMYQPDYDVILYSFSDLVMEEVIKETSHLKVHYGFLFIRLRKLKKLKKEIFEKLDYIHPHFITLLWHDKAISRLNKKINTWTVNSISIVKKLMKQKSFHLLEFIMTDYTDLRDKHNELLRGKK